MNSREITLERIVPDDIAGSGKIDQHSLQLHYERYAFAATHVQPGRVLDIACGTGYGSYMVATTNNAASEITAVDISADAIAYARQRYAHEKITFVEQDAFAFSSVTLFNTIISLETIEHLPEPQRFAKKLFDLLLPGGVLIISAPVTPSTDANPFHVNDFSFSSFRKLFANNMLKETNTLKQVQPYSLKEIFKSNNSERASHLRRNIGAYYLSHPSVLLLRIKSLFADGLNNKYLTLVLQKNTY
jgi:SAM-dependent methyltransferase